MMRADQDEGGVVDSGHELQEIVIEEETGGVHTQNTTARAAEYYVGATRRNGTPLGRGCARFVVVECEAEM